MPDAAPLDPDQTWVDQLTDLLVGTDITSTDPEHADTGTITRVWAHNGDFMLEATFDEVSGAIPLFALIDGDRQQWRLPKPVRRALRGLLSDLLIDWGRRLWRATRVRVEVDRAVHTASRARVWRDGALIFDGESHEARIVEPLARSGRPACENGVEGCDGHCDDALERETREATPTSEDCGGASDPEDPTRTTFHHSTGEFGIRRTPDGCWLTTSNRGVFTPLLANFGEASLAAEWVAKVLNDTATLRAAILAKDNARRRLPLTRSSGEIAAATNAVWEAARAVAGVGPYSQHPHEPDPATTFQDLQPGPAPGQPEAAVAQLGTAETIQARGPQPVDDPVDGNETAAHGVLNAVEVELHATGGPIKRTRPWVRVSAPGDERPRFIQCIVEVTEPVELVRIIGELDDSSVHADLDGPTLIPGTWTILVGPEVEDDHSFLGNDLRVGAGLFHSGIVYQARCGDSTVRGDATLRIFNLPPHRDSDGERRPVNLPVLDHTSSPIDAKTFIDRYRARTRERTYLSDAYLDGILAYRNVVPCTCGEPDCEGWAVVPLGEIEHRGIPEAATCPTCGYGRAHRGIGFDPGYEQAGIFVCPNPFHDPVVPDHDLTGVPETWSAGMDAQLAVVDKEILDRACALVGLAQDTGAGEATYDSAEMYRAIVRLVADAQAAGAGSVVDVIAHGAPSETALLEALRPVLSGAEVVDQKGTREVLYWRSDIRSGDVSIVDLLSAKDWALVDADVERRAIDTIWRWATGDDQGGGGNPGAISDTVRRAAAEDRS